MPSRVFHLPHAAENHKERLYFSSYFFFTLLLHWCCLHLPDSHFIFVSLTLRSLCPLFFFISSFLQRLHSHTLRAAFLQFLVALLPFTCYFICWFNRVLKLPSCDCCCRCCQRRRWRLRRRHSRRHSSLNGQWRKKGQADRMGKTNL